MSTLTEDHCGWSSATDASPPGSLLATGPHHPHPPRWVRPLPSSRHRHKTGHEKRPSSTVPDSQVEVHGEEKSEREREREAGGGTDLLGRRVLWVFLWQCLSWLL